MANATTIPCDACQGPLHLKCVGLSESDAVWTRARSKTIKVVCTNCNNNMSQFKDLKSLITSLQQDFLVNIEKLRSDFEAQLKDLKSSVNTTTSSPAHNFEEIVNEVAERQNRKQNLIMFGVDEQPNELNVNQATEQDRSSVNNVLNQIIPDYNIDNLKIHRIGRRSDTRARPIKITLNDEREVLQFIRNAKKLKNLNQFKNISISFDRTPRQMEFYKQVKSELNRRAANGETNLIIRHVNGIPKIVTLN